MPRDNSEAAAEARRRWQEEELELAEHRWTMLGLRWKELALERETVEVARWKRRLEKQAWEEEERQSKRRR